MQLRLGGIKVMKFANFWVIIVIIIIFIIIIMSSNLMLFALVIILFKQWCTPQLRLSSLQF
jgi:hypothetical protein